MIFVNIGFGFYVELTHDEALKFITKKTDNLDEKAKILTKDATSVKAHIKLVLEVTNSFCFVFYMLSVLSI